MWTAVWETEKHEIKGQRLRSFSFKFSAATLGPAHRSSSADARALQPQSGPDNVGYRTVKLFAASGFCSVQVKTDLFG